MNFNLGTQDKKKVIMAAAFGVVALGCLVYMGMQIFGGPSTPPPPPPAVVHTIAPPVRTTATTTASSESGVSTPTAANAATSGSQSQNPELKLDLIRLTESTEYNGTGRNVFSAVAAPPPMEAVKAPIRPLTPVVTAPTGPPPPPPIELQFYGYATSQGHNKRIFLKHGDDIFIASEGDIVNKRYRIKSIAANSVQIEDILYNNTQMISLSIPQG